MADDQRSPSSPVAVRITRPYATEDEFLEHEVETLSHTSVTLLGAQPRPQGVVLRFELILNTGQVLMRGEGRVVGFRPNAHQGLGGLTLRFTRLDSRSKALVDRAAAVRELRRPSHIPAAPSSAPASSGSARVSSVPPRPDAGVGPSSIGRPPKAEIPTPPRSPPDTALADASSPAAVWAPRNGSPASRDALLDRLRARGKALEPNAVERILANRKRPA